MNTFCYKLFNLQLGWIASVTTHGITTISATPPLHFLLGGHFVSSIPHLCYPLVELTSVKNNATWTKVEVLAIFLIDSSSFCFKKRFSNKSAMKQARVSHRRSFEKRPERIMFSSRICVEFCITQYLPRARAIVHRSGSTVNNSPS